MSVGKIDWEFIEGMFREKFCDLMFNAGPSLHVNKCYFKLIQGGMCVSFVQNMKNQDPVLFKLTI